MSMTGSVFFLGSLLFIVGSFGFVFLTDADHQSDEELQKTEGVIEKVDLSHKNVVSIHLNSRQGDDIFVQRQCSENIYEKLHRYIGSSVAILHDDGSLFYLGGRKRFWRATVVAGDIDLFDNESLKAELGGKNSRTRNIALTITIGGLALMVTPLFFMRVIRRKG